MLNLHPAVEQGWKVFLVVEDDPPTRLFGCDLPGFLTSRLQGRTPKRANYKPNNPVRATTTEMKFILKFTQKEGQAEKINNSVLPSVYCHVTPDGPRRCT